MYGSQMAVRTPWGMSQDAETFGDGITFYSTATHGGFKLDPSAQRAMPAALRMAGSWYEEDDDACLVIVAFPDRFSPKQVECAMSTVKDNYPDRYTKWTGKALDPAESRTLRARAFRERTADSYVVSSAWGDGFESIPKGMVGVCAFRRSTSEEAGFLLNAADYVRGEFGFVVDADKATPWIAPGKTKEVETIIAAPQEAAVNPSDLRTGRRIRYGDGIYILESPNNRSWIVKRDSDGRVFRMGPSHLKHSTVVDDEVNAA